MSAVWISVIVVGVATMAIKAAGPLLLARRTLPPRAQAALEHLAPALLAALVVTQALGGDNGGFTIDARLARLAGLAAAAVALLLRAPLLVVITVAAVTAALVRMVG
jgi:branched-subunit amino acid transport protein